MNVELTVEEREFVAAAGEARTEANKGKSDIADYNPKYLGFSKVQANKLGCFAEAAAFKALGGNILDHSLEEWAHFVPNDHPDYHHLIKENADLFGDVEVRRANSRYNPIPVRAKDREHAKYVLQVHVPWVRAHPTSNNPHPLITVGLTAQLTGWAFTTDTGPVPSYARSNSLQVVEPRPMNTFPLLLEGVAA